MREPLFPDAKMHLIRPKQPAVARVVETRLCTKGGKKAAGIVRHIALDVSGTAIAGKFLVGQSFGVLPPGRDSKGKPHALRLYSIASPSFGEDGSGNVVATTVKRTIGEREPQANDDDDDPSDHALFLGVASNFLCNLNIGDEVKITGPQGKRFLLPIDTSAHDYIFLATGTGIAPFRGMLMELLEGPAGPVRSQIHLIMGTAFTTDLLYDDWLRDLAAKHRNFHYHAAISREMSSPPGAGRDGCRGEYCHHVFARHFVQGFAPLFECGRALVYICGILGMQFGVYQEIARTSAADLYLTIHDDLKSSDPASWSIEDMKRKVHPARRLMVEVY